MVAIIRASYPINFHLLDRDERSVLGIFDGDKGQKSTLEIINTSRRDMKLKKLNGPEATAENHHFELKFRPGTLNLSSQAPITVEGGEAGWRISKPTDSRDGVSFFLLSTNPFVLHSGNKTTLKLDHLNGDGSGGARGTRVELKWKEGSLEYMVEATANPEPLVAGNRVHHLTITNERGKKDIPLHVGFAGTNQVLNNGTSNTLELRIINELEKGDIVLVPEKDPEFPPSKFIISFDASNTEEWTMGTLSQVGAFEMNAMSGTKKLNAIKTKEGKTTEWTISAINERLTLKPKDNVTIKISNIQTRHQPGETKLTLHYKNIPGYRDGDFVSIIEKSPVFYGKGAEVGVGTNTPESTLHVNGKLIVEKELSLKPSSVFDVDAIGSVGGRFKITADGKVGIGQPSPEKALSVKGGLRVENEVSIGGSGAFEVDAPNIHGGRFKVASDGKVGIGTNNPKAKLHVMGDVQIEKSKEILFEDFGQIRSFDNNHRILFRRDQNTMEFREYGQIVFSPGAIDGNETAKVSITADGRLGIGLKDPQLPLDIGSFHNYVFDKRFFKSLSGIEGPSVALVGIRCLGAIGSSTGFFTYSDARIKTNLKSSESTADLDVLSRLRVTDFKYIDGATCGNQQKKGLIAQEVEEVFPQAVSQLTGAVPDIYQHASHAGDWIELATDLKKGDRVRLISEHYDGVYEVLDVAPDRFRTDFKPNSDTVFVFGREVNDLRILDHDSIAVLNVSATQQLRKELDQQVKALRAENEVLKSANDVLAQRVQTLESKLEAILNVAGAVSGANGNGRR